MLLLAAALSLLPAQVGAPAAEDAAMFMPSRLPNSGDVDVARNAAFITSEQPSAASVVTFEGQNELLTPATVSTVEGLTVVTLPLQPALSNVTLRLSFPGGFTEDLSWTTGNELIEAPADPAVVARAVVLRPFMGTPHVEIELEANDRHAAAVLIALDGELRTRITTAVSFGADAGLFLGDYSFAGGSRDYEVIAIDRAGNVAEAVAVSVAEGGCAATPAAPLGALALLLLARRRGRAPRV